MGLRIKGYNLKYFIRDFSVLVYVPLSIHTAISVQEKF